MAHVIDGVAEQGGRLHTRNGFVYVIAATVGIGVGAPVGADTPSAMIADIWLPGSASDFISANCSFALWWWRALARASRPRTLHNWPRIFFALEIVLGGFGGVFYVVPTVIASGNVRVNHFLAQRCASPVCRAGGHFPLGWNHPALCGRGYVVHPRGHRLREFITAD